MPKGKEAKEAKKAAAKEAKKDKQLVKATKKKRKDLGLTSDDVDIETLLKKFQRTKNPSDSITKTPGRLVPCDQPSPRLACSLTLLNTNELLMFGGEFYEGSVATVFNETYRWNVDKNEWRLVETEPAPAPRCSHQAIAFKDGVYMFGGEFATTEQFYHFKDLWYFDIKLNTWEEIKCTGVSPSARSGHRMAPSPRSGFMMAAYPQGDGILVCGGYCKVKDTSSSAQGKCIHNAWWLNMKRVLSDVAVNAQPTNIWEPLGKKSMVPSVRAGTSFAMEIFFPGAAMVTHKSLGIMFGGVWDEDRGGSSLRSVYYNDIFAFDLEKKKWFPLRMQQQKKKGKASKPNAPCRPVHVETTAPSQTSESEASDNEIEYDSDDDDTTFGYIDQDGKLVRIKIEDFNEEELIDSKEKTDSLFVSTPAEIPDKDLKKEVASADFVKLANKVEKPKENTCREPPVLSPDPESPLPRLNSVLCIRGNELVVYGGLVELGKKDLTLDDCWAINLNTRQQWKAILKGHLDQHPWNEAQEDEDDNDDDNEDNEDDDDSDTDSEEYSSDGSPEKPPKVSLISIRKEMEELKKKLAIDSELKTPKATESLKEFFHRTKNYWMTEFSNTVQEGGLDRKELRKGGFELAAGRFSELEPVLQRMATLEEIQKNAEASQ